MTTATRTHSWKNDTTNNILAFISNTKSLITSVGLTVTDDTTVSSPGTGFANDNYGTVTFALPDTLQATTPIFISLRFGSDGNARPNVIHTVGSQKDGSGSVTSPNMASNHGNPGGTYQESITSYASYADGTFAMVLGYGASSSVTNNNALASLVVDRARTNAGVAQAAGYLAEGNYVSFSSQPQARSFYGPASPAAGTQFIPSLIPSQNAVSTAEGANVNVFRHYSMVPGVRPQVGMLTYFNSEFGALTPFSATVLGSAHTYLPMGYAMNYWSANVYKEHCCAIRWE